MDIRKLWKQWKGQVGDSDSSPQPIPIKLESPQVGNLVGNHPQEAMRGLASQIHEESSSLSSQVDKLYWMCFRDPGDNFVGIVISRGKSPGATASAVINDGIVESEKATILALDEKY